MNLIERAQAALEGLGRPYEVLCAMTAERPVYLVGGTLRDIIMGREPADFDFAVAGSGIEFSRSYARRLHGKFVPLSEPDDQARVVYRKLTVLDFNGFGDGTIDDDLRRRDFTANALALRLGGGPELLDPFSGQVAIRQRRLIPVSDRSLAIDPLRLLRALRLALELGFDIVPEVYEQARSISLDGIAPERIGGELLRVMDCERSCPHIERLFRMGFLHQILPEARPLLDQPALMKHSLGTYRKLEELLHRRSYFSNYAPEMEAFVRTGEHSVGLLKLAGLLHDAGKPETEFVNDRQEVHFYGHDSLGAHYVEQIARERLRLSRTETRALKLLVESHMRLHLLATAPELTDRAIRRYFRDLGEQWFGMMLLTFADGFATAGFTGHLEETFGRMIALKRQYDSVIRIERLVNGDDLIALGLKPGPTFKTILAELQELQVEGRITSKAEGVEHLKKNMSHLLDKAGQDESLRERKAAK